MSEKQCPLCSKPGLRPFATFPNIPATGILCTTATDTVPHRDLVFDYCPHCACITQCNNSSPMIDYSQVARPTARQLPDYAKSLLMRLREEDPDALVVEVGCNDGTFLSELRSAGFTRRLGIEPSQTLAAIVRDAGHTVMACTFDAEVAQACVEQRGTAGIVVCRHTLEHVPQPLAFLAALRALLTPGGLACIEVPSLSPIIERLHAHELWDEHLTYFLPENLTAAIINSGFAIEAVTTEPHRGMQNIVVWARAISTAVPTNSGFPCNPEAAALCARFSGRWHAVAERLRTMVSAAPSPRVVLGASHPQANLLNFCGLANLVDVAIDDDPVKTGRWLPLGNRAVPIRPSLSLTEAVHDGTLLLTAFGYPEWMARTRAMAENHNVAVIDLTSSLGCDLN